jgi:hypothetical protein
LEDIFDGGDEGAADADVAGWTKAVGTAFLEPYDLNHDYSTFTAAGTSGKIHEAVSSLPAMKVYEYNHDGARWGVGCWFWTFAMQSSCKALLQVSMQLHVTSYIYMCCKW